MNSSSGTLKVGIIGKAVLIRILGRATFSISIDFKKLVQELADKGYRNFLIELSECVMMDSTFLGVLAGVGLKFSYPELPGNPPESAPVQLVNPNQRLRETFENLGISHLFTITDENSCLPADTSTEAAPHQEASKVELTRNCLEAHKLLMEINPENEAKFKDVAQFFAEDLKRMQQEGK
jgi:anti-anti-sigma regulatory factor